MDGIYGIDGKGVCRTIMKYIVSGGAVAAAAFFVPQRTMRPDELVMIAFTAAAVFAVLEMFAPRVYQGTQFGTGFGIGAGSIVPLEGFDDAKPACVNDVRLPERKRCFRFREEGAGPMARNCSLDEFF